MEMTVTEAISTYRKYRKRLRKIQGRSERSLLARQHNQDQADAILKHLVSKGYAALAEDLIAEATLVRRLGCQGLPASHRPGLEDELGYIRARISHDAKKHGVELIGTELASTQRKASRL